MKVCGIEIKGNAAILTCLSGSKKDYEIIAKDRKKVSIKDTKNQDDIKEFHASIVAFFTEFQFEKIGIKARGEKGKFAGGPLSFKIEGLIQNTDFDVDVIHIATIKAGIKNINPDFTLINKYQEESLKTALYLLP